MAQPSHSTSGDLAAYPAPHELNQGPRRSILGLDIGGAKTAILEGTSDGQILQRIELATLAHQPYRLTFPRIADRLRAVIHEANGGARSIVALSVSVGGPLKIREGVLLNPPHLPGWHQADLRALLTPWETESATSPR